MRRRRLAAAVALTVMASLAAACSSDGGPSADDPRPTTTSTTEPSTTTTTTRPADLAVASVTLTPVAPADAPTALASRPGDDALYVAEQGGRVLAVVDGAVAPAPVLDVSDRVNAGGEQGLLGLTLSPDGERHYAHNTGARGETTGDQ
jgi:glucose/arabinose dehydrogenase